MRICSTIRNSLVLGLTAKQFLFSTLALSVGTGIAQLLYQKIGIILSYYVATPFVVPLAYDIEIGVEGYEKSKWLRVEKTVTEKLTFSKELGIPFPKKMFDTTSDAWSK